MMGPTVILKGTLTLPHIVNPQLNFNLTQIHTTTSQYVRIHNPSDHPLQVQLFLSFGGCTSWWRWLWWWWGWSSSSWRWSWCSESPFYLPTDVTHTTYLLPPQATHDFGPLYFAPNSLRSENTTLLVRNNLTVVETVLITGAGGSGLFQFLSEESESDHKHFLQHSSVLSSDLSSPPLETTTLLFTLRPEQLSNCNLTTLTFTHTFTALNAGNLPIHITTIAIDGRSWYSLIYECLSNIIFYFSFIKLSISLNNFTYAQ